MFWRRLWLGLLAWAAGVAGSGAAEEPAPGAERPWAEVRQETFDVVWSTVNEAYFDAKFGGVDWKAVGEKYHARLADAADKPALRALLQQMLGELHRSHFAIMPRDAAVFTPEERVRIGTLGATVGWVDDAVVFTQVKPGGPAATAGVRPGTAVRALDGRELQKMLLVLQNDAGFEHLRAGQHLAAWVKAKFAAPVGSKIELVIEPSGGAEQTVALESAPHNGVWSEPVGNFPSFPVEVEIRREAEGVTYLRFNVFARAVMTDVREGLLSTPREDGLVLDLRGNPGGLAPMAGGIAGWLSDRQLWLGRMQMRQGVMQFTGFPQEGAYTGPVAVLIDSGSASTSELMAAGLQATGRARVFGERSAGQALPSAFKQLPIGDLFQFAMADIVTPRGKSLEGAGVVPDEIVERHRADLAAGDDKVLDAARAWLRAERAKPAAERLTGQLNPRKS
jgi:carboxyl-terminal processing protease